MADFPSAQEEANKTALLADSLHSPDKTPPNPLLLHTPQWVFTSEALLQWKGQVEEEDKKQRALLEQILDRSTAVTLDEFDVQFSAYLKHLQLKRSKGLKIPLDPNHFKVPSLQVQTLLAERMVKEDRYWPSKQLCQVFQLQWVPYSHLTQLCSMAVEQNDENFLKSVLLHSTHLPETALVRIVLFLLNAVADEKQKELFSLVLSKNFNESLLIGELRAWSIEDSLALLGVLYSRLKKNDFVSRSPPFPHLVRWACAVVDAQFSALVLCQEAEKVLLHLRNVTVQQMTTLDKLSVLDECLQKISQKKPALPDRGLYVIDTIVLPF